MAHKSVRSQVFIVPIARRWRSLGCFHFAASRRTGQWPDRKGGREALIRKTPSLTVGLLPADQVGFSPIQIAETPKGRSIFFITSASSFNGSDNNPFNHCRLFGHGFTSDSAA